MSDEWTHETVLLEPAVEALSISDGLYVDGTFGRGGHSRLILKKLDPLGHLLAFDQDPQAIAAGKELLGEDSRLELVHSPFSGLQQLLAQRESPLGGSAQVSGILLDLGVSSPQLDEAERGFSFLRNGPLDMRMNPTQGISAAQWINSAKEVDIANVMYTYGDERHSRRMARAIVAHRQKEAITTTHTLAEIVKQANPSWEKGKHPATRAFQGIRIYINRELEELEAILEQALSVLRIGGRLVVISFHSLEDRMVKKFFVKQARGDDFPRDLPIMQDQLNPLLKIIGKPIKADASEVRINPRARSAIMRVAERIA